MGKNAEPHFIQNCLCFQPKFKLKDIAFNAEYLVEVSLLTDQKWHGKMTFWTPSCAEVRPLDQTYCLEDIENKPRLVTKPSTTTQSARLDRIFFAGKNSTQCRLL